MNEKEITQQDVWRAELAYATQALESEKLKQSYWTLSAEIMKQTHEIEMINHQARLEASRIDFINRYDYSLDDDVREKTKPIRDRWDALVIRIEDKIKEWLGK